MRAVNTQTVAPPIAAEARAAAAHRRRWRRTQWFTGVLLAAWFVAGFGVTWFARDLDFAFFDWPFSYWAAAQGGTLVFVLLIAAYARGMARIDRAHEREARPDGQDPS